MFFILAQVADGDPWWLTAITGSGGALIVLMMWVKNLLNSIKTKDEELIKISKESIECITKVIEKHNQDTPWKNKVETLITDIQSSIRKIETEKGIR